MIQKSKGLWISFKKKRFVRDIIAHLTDLNVKLQERNDTVSDLKSPVHVLQRKFTLDIEKGTLHFPKLLDQARGGKKSASESGWAPRELPNLLWGIGKTSSTVQWKSINYLSEMSQHFHWKNRKSTPGSVQLLCKVSWLSSHKDSCCTRRDWNAGI